MEIKYVHTRDVGYRYIAEAMKKKELPPHLTEAKLLSLESTTHDILATQIFCTAATWAYADLTDFVATMSNFGLFGEFLEINMANDPALVDTTAYLYLSASARLAILTFRGTEMGNLVQWLANASTAMEPLEEGRVHGGFLRPVAYTLPLIEEFLRPWAKNGQNFAESFIELRRVSPVPKEFFPTENFLKEGADAMAFVRDTLHDKEHGIFDSDSRPALYICGHSLGGAYAALTAAIAHLRLEFSPIRDTLRSIYTFGQPMIVDKALAEMLDELLGKRVFRHRYGNDIVPRLPGRIQGNFHHFGRGYVNSKGVWVGEKIDLLRRTLGNGQTFGVVGSNLVGVLEWANQQIPALRWIPLSLSWGDHSPHHYMRTSQGSQPGWELQGPSFDAHHK